MVKKLRRKFIFIFMVITTVTVAGILFFLAFSSYESQSRECEEALSDYFSKPRKSGQEDRSILFTVKYSKSGKKIEDTWSEDLVSISGEKADELAEQSYRSDKMFELLWEDSVAFMKRKRPDGTTIAFYDLTGSRNYLKSLFLSLLMAGLAALVILYIISLFLGNWCVRPIEEAWRKQQQFVADASHELKTPLTVILANTSMLMESGDSLISEKKKSIRYIEEEAAHMSGLVNDLLFLAKSDFQKQSQAKGIVNASEICMNSYLSFEPVAYEKQLTMISDIEPDREIMGFSDKLEQLCRILLDNACKYTACGGEIRMDLHKKRNHLLLEVNNSGASIPKEAISRLFERFYRVDEARTRGQNGYGLGLSIADQIVSLHGGKIQIFSSEEQGVTVAVEFPCPRQDKNQSRSFG